MKKYIIALAIVLSIPLASFAAVKATGIDFVNSVTVGPQKVSKWKDNDTGIICYTAMSTNSTNVSVSQVSISCVK